MHDIHYIQVLVLFIDDNYEIRRNSWCQPLSKSFQTLSGAQSECNDDPSCPMVYDNLGPGKRFFTCGKEANITISSSGSLLFIKRSK